MRSIVYGHFFQISLQEFADDDSCSSATVASKPINQQIVMKLSLSSLLSRPSYCFLLALVLTGTSAYAQLQWSVYDKNGVLVTANAASGGDSTYGGGVTFTIPGSTQYEVVTKTFVPFSTPVAGNAGKVTFNISASGGLSGRCFGFGLFSDPGTLIQAMGYWGDFNIWDRILSVFNEIGQMQRSWSMTAEMR